jgi:hypothetical protein
MAMQAACERAILVSLVVATFFHSCIECMSQVVQAECIYIVACAGN